MKVAIILTTFLRDNLLYKTLQTIVDNPVSDCILLIADQGYSSDEKSITVDYTKSQIPCEYYKLPFDCGAYFARNFLVKKAQELGCDYCLISADSIQFKEKYNFEPIINFLNSNEKIALCGFELEDSKCAWEYEMELTKKGIKFLYPTKFITVNEIKYTKVDICRNIYLAKTKALIDSPYDEELKLGGHELNFWNLKQKGWECYWTDSLIFKRVSNTNNEYSEYRKRFSDYLQIAKQKLGITGWVIYPPKIRTKNNSK